MKELTIVIFGVTGDLAAKKLIPALLSLHDNGLLPEKVKIIGLANRERSIAGMKSFFTESITTKYGSSKTEALKKFWQRVNFVYGDFGKEEIYQKLKKELGKKGEVIIYLATFPELYERIFVGLKGIGLSKHVHDHLKVLIEKPIGFDQVSAKKINGLLADHFLEQQIFRIDHYLAKETVQNLLTFRSYNPVVEMMLERGGIDHVQITAAESFGVESRKNYYEALGALKDVGQNHILQMLALSLMDKPAEFSHREILEARKRTFKTLKPMPESLVLGQYEGYGGGKTDTFFAFKTELGEGAMAGVPIYVRGGKKLPKTVAEISIVFKKEVGTLPNVLIFRIQPNEGIVLAMTMKKPGYELINQQTLMQYCYRSTNENLIEAHERLMVDAIKGEQTFFNGAEEIESQWKFIDSLEPGKATPIKYPEGSWGPKEAMELIEKDGRSWLLPSEDICRI